MASTRKSCGENADDITTSVRGRGRRRRPRRRRPGARGRPFPSQFSAKTSAPPVSANPMASPLLPRRGRAKHKKRKKKSDESILGTPSRRRRRRRCRRRLCGCVWFFFCVSFLVVCVGGWLASIDYLLVNGMSPLASGQRRVEYPEIAVGGRGAKLLHVISAGQKWRRRLRLLLLLLLLLRWC